jgi:hypothetical protein
MTASSALLPSVESAANDWIEPRADLRRVPVDGSFVPEAVIHAPRSQTATNSGIDSYGRALQVLNPEHMLLMGVAEQNC